MDKFEALNLFWGFLSSDVRAVRRWACPWSLSFGSAEDRQPAVNFDCCAGPIIVSISVFHDRFCLHCVAEVLTVIYFVSLQLEFWICLLLTILGYIPGILYALYVIVR